MIEHQKNTDTLCQDGYIALSKKQDDFESAKSYLFSAKQQGIILSNKYTVEVFLLAVAFKEKNIFPYLNDAINTGVYDMRIAHAVQKIKVSKKDFSILENRIKSTKNPILYATLLYLSLQHEIWGMVKQYTDNIGQSGISKNDCTQIMHYIESEYT
jgi:hypothetical protein